ncbi:hypothetical protein ElyMa_005825700 [Elysia marginata]|uniref:Uncharacterized protein n=1 Tax=Elysia marginata TaxID=1093978 RepID=A0AAV4FW38_9GAST|nr:hypothetical protein ElyMa_005825700 [Elysia marginata]
MIKSASAPSHNTSSERHLGSFDRLYRRAPNATAGFLTGKVKCKMNGTLEWLTAKGKEERETMLQFVVNEAKEERVRKFEEAEQLKTEIAGRRQEVAKSRKNSKVSGALRQIKKFLKSKDTNDLSCSEAVKSRLSAYIEDPSSVLGMLVIHTIDGLDWYARILHLNEKQELFDLSYWSINDTESSRVDFTVSVKQFYAEAMLGDIAFL